MLSRIIDLYLPDTCALCQILIDKRQPHLCCTHCWSDLPWLDHQCRHCGLALPEPDPRMRPLVCGHCLTQPLTKGIAIVPLAYNDDTQRLVHELKLQNNLRAAEVLSVALATRIQATYGMRPRPQYIVPTPLTWRRRVIRGYNQTARLAFSLADKLSIPVHSMLSRRHGPSQHGRNRRAREALPLNTFYTRRQLPADTRHIALLDDVVTTGSTMRVMAHTMQSAGVRRIDIWAPCRAALQ